MPVEIRCFPEQLLQMRNAYETLHGPCEIILIGHVGNSSGAFIVTGFSPIAGRLMIDCWLGENLSVADGYRIIFVPKRYGQMP